MNHLGMLNCYPEAFAELFERKSMSVQLSYTGDQIADLVNARRAHRDMSQRELARHIYDHAHLIYPSLLGRTWSSIYAAIRRVEARSAMIQTQALEAAAPLRNA